MDREEAVYLLMSADREELRDHAFGDAEVYWRKDGKDIAIGYFGGEQTRITVYEEDSGEHGFLKAGFTFTDDDARKLRDTGKLNRVDRNDSTGPGEYVEGQCMPGLTREDVRKELSSEG